MIELKQFLIQRNNLIILLAFLITIAIAFGAMQSFAVTANDANKSTEKVPQTHIYFDKRVYGFGQKAIVFLLDKNLNKHHDGIDTYRPRSGFVFLEIAGKRMPDSFTQKVFQTSFIETGPNTGIFKAKLKIPTTDDAGRSTKGKDLRITYVDVNNSVTWHDTVTIL